MAITQPSNDDPTFISSFKRGVQLGQAMSYGALQTLGDLIGSDTIAKWGEEGTIRNLQQAALHPPKIQSWDEVDNLYDFGMYVIQAVGEQAGQWIPGLLIPGGVGVAGGRMAVAGFGKAMLRKLGPQKANLLSNQIRSRATKVGVGAGIVALNTGETQINFNEAGLNQPVDVLIAGALKSSLDAVGISRMFNLARVHGRTPIGMVKEAMATAGVEAGTESVQTVVDFLALNANIPGYEVFSPENLRELREAAIRGGIVGGVMSGVSVVVDDVRKDRPIDGEIVPESQSTIDAQARAVNDPTSTKDTIQVTEGTPAPTEEIRGGIEVDTPTGPVITTDPQKAEDIEAAGGSEESIGEALYGQENGKQDTDGTVLVVRDAAGAPIAEVATNREEINNLAEKLRPQIPEGGSMSVSNAEEVIQERTAENEREANNAKVHETGIVDEHRESIQRLQELALSESGDTDVDQAAAELVERARILQEQKNVGETESLALAIEEFTRRLENERSRRDAPGETVSEDSLESSDGVEEGEVLYSGDDRVYSGYKYPSQAEEKVEQLRIDDPLAEVTTEGNMRTGYTVKAKKRRFETESEAADVATELTESMPGYSVAPAKEKDGTFTLSRTLIPSQVNEEMIVTNYKGESMPVSERVTRGMNEARFRAAALARQAAAKKLPESQAGQILYMEDADGKPVNFRAANLTTMGMDINKRVSDADARSELQAAHEGFMTALSELMFRGYKVVNQRQLTDPNFKIYARSKDELYSMAEIQKSMRDNVEPVVEIQSLERQVRNLESQKSTENDSWGNAADGQIGSLKAQIREKKKAARKSPRGGKAGLTQDTVKGQPDYYAGGIEGANDQEAIDNYERTEEQEESAYDDEDRSPTDNSRLSDYRRESFHSRWRWNRWRTKPGEGLTKAEAQATVAELVKSLGDKLNEYGIEIVVHAGRSSDYRDANGVPLDNFAGYISQDGKRIHIFADAHGTKDAIARTVRHELLGHWGVKAFLTAEQEKALIDQVIRSKASLFEVWAHVKLVYPDLSEVEQAHEVLARVAENTSIDGVRPGLLRRLRSTIERALRRAGLLKGQISRDEIEGLLQDFANALRDGNPKMRDVRFDQTLNRKIFEKATVSKLRQKIIDINNGVLKHSVGGFLFTAHGRLAAYSKTLADKLYQETNSVVEEVSLWGGINRGWRKWNGRLNRIVRKYDKDTLEVAFYQLARELPTKDLNEAAKELRTFLETYHSEYLQAHLPTLGTVKDYFPRLYDTFAIQQRKEEFIELLTKHGVENARETMDNIISIQEASIRESRSFMSMRTKVLQQRMMKDPKLIRALVDAGFLNVNPVESLYSYIHSTVKRAEYESRFGGYEKVKKYYNKAELDAASWALRPTLDKSNQTVLRRIALESDLYPDKDLLAKFRDAMQSLKALRLEERTHRRAGTKIPPELTQEIEKAERLIKSLESSAKQEHIDSTLDNMRKFNHLQENDAGELGLYNPNSRLRAFILQDENIKEADYEKVKQLVMSTIETAPVDRSTWHYNLLGQFRAYETLRVLLMSGVASIPETAAIFARAKETIGTVEFFKIIGEVRSHYKEMREYVEDLGVIQKGAAVAMMQEMYGPGVGESTGRWDLRNAVPYLFKLNGNDFVVNFTKLISIEVGRRFLARNAETALFGEGAAKERAIRYLKELNVTPEDVKVWESYNFIHPDEVPGKDHAAAWRAHGALVQFSSESVLEPNSAERPTWVNHPLGSLVAHLKSYMYSFNKKVILGMVREVDARAQAGDRMVTALPFILAAVGVFMFFGGLSDEVRNRLLSLGQKGTWEANWKDPGNMAQKWFDRSGLWSMPFGDFLVDPSMDSATFAAGPAFSHAYEIFFEDPPGDNDALKKTLRSIPILSQSTTLRNEVYKAIEGQTGFD